MSAISGASLAQANMLDLFKQMQESIVKNVNDQAAIALTQQVADSQMATVNSVLDILV